jgi:WD40 repeat protein
MSHVEEHESSGDEQVLEDDQIVEVIEDLDADPIDEDMDDAEEMEFDELAQEQVQDLSSGRWGTGQPNHSFFSVRFSPIPVNDAYLALVGCQDDKAYVWNTSNGETVATLERHADSVIAVAWSHPDGKYLATGGMDGKVIVWHGLQGTLGSLICELEGPSEVTVRLVESSAPILPRIQY